jgi:hypothetical protein
MRSFCSVIFTLFLIALAPAARADSISCVAGTVTSIANTTCAINGILFTFGNAAIQNPDNLASVTTGALTFTPDATLAGFVISGAITGTNGGGSRDGLDLGVSYSTLDGLAWTTGITTGFTGATTGGNGNSTAFTQFFQFDSANSGNFLITDPGLANNATSCFTGPGSTGTFNCTRTYPNAMVASTTALSGLTFGIVDDSGTSIINSGEFLVTGTQPVSLTPEPSPAVLLLGGFGLIAFGRLKTKPASSRA